MTEPALIHTHVERDEATDLLVRDVMVRRPKALPSDATVADLRAMFADPRVQCALDVLHLHAGLVARRRRRRRRRQAPMSSISVTATPASRYHVRFSLHSTVGPITPA
jgi:hypothetical protein